MRASVFFELQAAPLRRLAGRGPRWWRCAAIAALAALGGRMSASRPRCRSCARRGSRWRRCSLATARRRAGARVASRRRADAAATAAWTFVADAGAAAQPARSRWRSTSAPGCCCASSTRRPATGSLAAGAAARPGGALARPALRGVCAAALRRRRADGPRAAAPNERSRRRRPAGRARQARRRQGVRDAGRQVPAPHRAADRPHGARRRPGAGHRPGDLHPRLPGDAAVPRRQRVLHLAVPDRGQHRQEGADGAQARPAGHRIGARRRATRTTKLRASRTN